LQPQKDIIVAVNDIPVTGISSYIKAIYTLRQFSPVAITVQRDGTHQVTFHITPEFMLLKPDWIFTFLLACTLIVTGFYILLKVHNSRYYPVVITLFLFLLSVCVRPFYYNSLFSFILVQAGTFAVWFLPVFTFYFPYPRFNKTIRRMGVSFFLLCPGVLSAFSCFVYAARGGDPNSWYLHLTILDKIRGTGETGLFILFCILLFRSYSKIVSLNIKNQVQWILAGFILAFSPYFFFEHLPFILGDIPGESISLGNFTHLFICIFPLFFLTGLSDRTREKYSFSIPQSVYFFISIPLVLFIFLLTAEPFSVYLVKEYGFSVSSASLFYAFLYLLVIFPVLLWGRTRINRIFFPGIYTTSLHYIASLKSENALLKEKNSTREQYNKAKLQTDKVKDISTIISGMYTRVKKRSQSIFTSLLAVKKKINRSISLLQKYPGIEESGILDNYNDVSHTLATIIEENMKLKELVEQIHKEFYIKPSLPLWIESNDIIRQCVDDVQKLFPGIPVITRLKKSGHFFCHPREMNRALVSIISFIMETNHNGDSDIILKNHADDTNVVIEIEYNNRGIHYGNPENLFRLFVKGHHGLGLYTSKVLIEKNSGNISAFYTDTGMNFLLTFPRKKPL
jgi:signal transduction histidine kinase